MEDKNVGCVVLFDYFGTKIAGIVFDKTSRKSLLGECKVRSKRTESFVRVFGGMFVGINRYLLIESKELTLLCEGKKPSCISDLLIHQEDYLFQLSDDYRESVVSELQFLLAFMISEKSSLLSRISRAFLEEFKEGIGFVTHQRIRIRKKGKLFKKEKQDSHEN